MKTTPDTRPLAERITQGPVTNGTLEGTIKDRFQRIIVAAFDLRSDDSCEEQEANAELVLEAFTVCHETGCTPRQLADERAELIAALELIHQHGGFRGPEHYQLVSKLLTRLQS